MPADNTCYKSRHLLFRVSKDAITLGDLDTFRLRHKVRDFAVVDSSLQKGFYVCFASKSAGRFSLSLGDKSLARKLHLTNLSDVKLLRMKNTYYTLPFYFYSELNPAETTPDQVLICTGIFAVMANCCLYNRMQRLSRGLVHRPSQAYVKHLCPPKLMHRGVCFEDDSSDGDDCRLGIDE